MKPSVQKLRNFFRLEAERDYDNGAVLGGLENMLETWQAEARAEELNEALVNAIAARLRDYGRLSPDGREEALKGIWQRVRREVGIEEDKAPQLPKKRKPKQEKATQLAPKASDSPAPAEPSAESENGGNRARRQRKPIQGALADLSEPVTVLDGVGPKNAERLEKLGIKSLGQLLYHFPRRYDDYSQMRSIRELHYGEEVTVIGTVQSTSNRKLRGGQRSIAEAVVEDGTAALRISWFNQPWVLKNLNEGDQIVFSGTVDQYLGRLTMSNPEWEQLESEQLHTKRIVPVYPLTEKIGQRWLRGMMNKVVKQWSPQVDDPLPDSILNSADLIPKAEALEQVHFPDSWEDLVAARHRLAFEELFMLQLAMLRQKEQFKTGKTRAFEAPADWLQSQLARLPFELTGAQQRSLEDICKNLASGQPMNRLLQGDVGSGKTVIAAMAMAIIAREGAQSALMAPTSILAEQHYAGLNKLLASEGGPLEAKEIRLLVGGTPDAEKIEIRNGLANGEIKVVIGTHALIEDPVIFSELELVVIDEQHRFGVDQRASLRDKGHNPHLLVVTATPIPRSLALTIYGDLDLSVIDELPPGRQEVGTHILYPQERERAYSLIRSQVQEGRQAFIIYPLVEGSEKTQALAAVDEHKKLQKEVFPNLEVALLHGRMSADEKEATMTQFRDGEADVLVSTSVIEVGVDIPNATVMLIESANRFGLAQLHQFRGRVGRGTEKSFCILIPDHEDAAENKRLKAMTDTNDGFLLAERDLEQRGPGQFLGTRQSGFDGFYMASFSDARTIEKAHRQAEKLLEADSALSAPENTKLREALDIFWNRAKGDMH